MLSHSKCLGLSMANAIQALDDSLVENQILAPDRVEVRFTVLSGDKKFGILVSLTNEMLRSLDREEE